jgi:phosphoribosyl 1,2-cyclic phosphodiesterase
MNGDLNMLNITPLFSSSKGNSIYIESDDTRLLVDAGVSAKQIVLSLEKINVNIKTIEAILVTHEHTDHIKGIKVLASKYNIPVFSTQKTWTKLSQSDIAATLKNTFEIDKEFSVGNIKVLAFSTPHDAIDPCGFNFFYGNEKVTLATDLGHINNYLLEKMEKSNTILLEANHDIEMLKAGSYPWPLKQRILGDYGHLSNITSALTIEYLIKTGTKNFILGHLSQENNFPELALETIKSRLRSNNICMNNINLVVARPSAL